MSLIHVRRAEKLGQADADNPSALEAVRSSGDLSEVRSEAGCNMLLVYLLRRWGSIFSPGASARLGRTEAFQDAVVDAYVAAGCSVDDAVAPRGFRNHLPADFTRMGKLGGEPLSALGFVQIVLAQIDADMFPDLHPQLERLEARLRGAERSRSTPRAFGPEHASASLVHGVRVHVTLGSAALTELRETAEALKLAVILGGDVGNLPANAALDAVVGVELTSADAEVGDPVPVRTDAQPNETQRRWLESLGGLGTHLVAFGPLASAFVVRGVVGGEVIASVTLGVTACELPESADLFLLVRYD